MSNKISWYKKAVIYEIFIRSFCDSNNDGIGDIQGIIHKLDYLENLGIDAIWLTPIYASPNKDSGYDVSDYYKIESVFGTFEDIEKMIFEAHRRNIKVIMEMVANHTSSEHRWFKSAKKSKESPYRAYYIWRDNINNSVPNNWISSRTGKPVWTYLPEIDAYYLHLYTSYQPDLNWENSDLRKEIINIIKFWLSKGVDAFRLDVINKIAKKEGLPNVDPSRPNGYAELYFENQPKVHEYINELREEVIKEYPECIFIGQTSGIDLDQAFSYTLDEKKQLDLFLQFEHTDMDKGPLGTLKQFDLEKFKSIIFKWQNAFDGRLWNTIFLGSHDLPRMVSHYGDCTNLEKSAKMLATVQLLLRGTQIIYMGDEIGMTNVNYKHIDDYRDIRTMDYYTKRIDENKENKESVFRDIQKISRDNARSPMQWNASKYAGFSTNKPWMRENRHYKTINVERQMKEVDSILNYYRALISLRKSEEILLMGKTEEIKLGKNIVAYKRKYEKEEITIIGNFVNRNIELDLPDYGEKIFGNYLENISNRLMPYEVRVLKHISR